MIITYPDEVTHRAIIKTIYDLMREVSPTGTVTIPAVVLDRGERLVVHKGAPVFWVFILKGRDMKRLIEDNMEF